MVEDVAAINQLPVIRMFAWRAQRFYRALFNGAHTRKRVCLVTQIEGAKGNRKLTQEPSNFGGGLK
jgi:hypothetical protein